MTKVIPFRRGRDELAFLPAALEIVETPPSPVGRTAAFILAGLFTAALAWSWWGTIDIVASATGKIVPNGSTKVIQPFETGVVRAIRVQDGQPVKAGDVLIELDTTMNMAERDHFKSDLTAAQLDIARLRAALSDAENVRHAMVEAVRVPAALVSLVNIADLLNKSRGEYAYTLIDADGEVSAPLLERLCAIEGVLTAYVL